MFSSVQSLSCVQLFATPWTAARQASLSITNSWSFPKPMSIESVMPSNHLTLCRPLLLLPPIFPSIRVFSNESALRIQWPKYWSFSFNINPSSEHPGPICTWKKWRGSVWYRLLVLTYMCSFTVLQFKYFLAPLVSVMWLSSGQWTSSADHDIFQVDFHSLFSQATLLKMKDSKGLKYATTGEKELELLSHCLEGRYIRFCKTRNKVCHWKLLFVFYSS